MLWKHLIALSIVGLCVGVWGTSAMAIEEAQYSVESKYDHFEVRRYGPTLVAETRVEAPFEEAGDQAFRVLADYIFGNNRASAAIDMTAPVAMAKSEKIAMTAPVSMAQTKGGYIVRFTMPAKYTLKTIPLPNNSRVQLIEVPAKRFAVFRYSGTWSEERFNNKLREFRDELGKLKFETTGSPIFARFNPPFLPWFLRRNEIWLEMVDQGTLPSQ